MLFLKKSIQSKQKLGIYNNIFEIKNVQIILITITCNYKQIAEI